jgi:CAAX protease family protein
MTLGLRFGRFVAITFALTWALQMAGVFGPAAMYVPLVALAGVMPSAVGLVMARQRGVGARGLLGPRPAVGWLAAALLGPAAMAAAAAGLATAAGGGWIVRAPDAAVVIVTALGEELGWRGYALRALEGRLRPAAASVAVAAIWALWHLPISLATGSTLADFLPWSISVVAMGSIMGWLWYRTRGATITAILAHASINAAPLLAEGSLAARLVAILAYVAVAVALWRLRPPGYGMIGASVVTPAPNQRIAPSSTSTEAPVFGSRVTIAPPPLPPRSTNP